VKALAIQLSKESFEYEVRCYDDGSSQAYKNINVFPNSTVVYKELRNNIGRSAIRNMLAEESIGEYLLFLDCDSGIFSHDFIKQYIKHSKDAELILGGTIYPRNLSSSKVSLRWKYGREREMRTAASRNLDPYEGLNLNNTFIRRATFLKYKLDETISTYGHEDTLFGYKLKESKVSVLHIDNAVDHLGLEENKVFLEKSKVAVRNFYKIAVMGTNGHDTKLYKAFNTLEKWNLVYPFSTLYSVLESLIEKNLLSDNPSLRLFDLFKLNEYVKAALKR
jgi:hypothetical protein